MTREEVKNMLLKLQEARDAGILTDEEYNRKINALKAEVESFVANSKKEAESEDRSEEPEDPGFQEFSSEGGSSSVEEDDGVVYFDANDNAQKNAGSDAGAFTAQNPTGNAGKPKKKGKKKWFIIGGILLLLIIIGSIGSCGGDNETYEWPSDSETAQMLPEPEGEITYISVDDDEGYECLDAYITVSGGNACKAYIDACKEKGFTEDVDSSQSDGDYDFTAKNSDGWQLNVYNFGDDMTIDLQSPGYLSGMDSEEEETTEAKEKETSSDFKATMDEYEAFMDDYITFMEKYNDSDDTSGMLTDYAEMLEQYGEFTEKIDAIDEDSLSESDYAYYVEVTTRVANKLAKANIE